MFQIVTQYYLLIYVFWNVLSFIWRSFISPSGSSVRLRGQQHNNCGAFRCLGQTQELWRQFLLQQELCVQQPLGIVAREAQIPGPDTSVQYNQRAAPRIMKKWLAHDGDSLRGWYLFISVEPEAVISWCALNIYFFICIFLKKKNNNKKQQKSLTSQWSPRCKLGSYLKGQNVDRKLWWLSSM